MAGGGAEEVNEEEVARARAFLKKVPKTRSIGRASYTGSYVLKHVAEKLAGDYVSNAALIEAARREGFDMRPPSPGSINMDINVAGPSKWLLSEKEYEVVAGYLGLTRRYRPR